MEKEQYRLLFEAEERHWWYLGMRRIFQELICLYYRNGCDGEVLDVGCGTGGTTRYLSRYGRVTGVDISAEALTYGQERGLNRLLRAAVDSLPFADSSFDLVCCFEVIYHQLIGDDRLALQEFYRVLRPKGILFLREPAYNWLRGAHDIAVHTRHRYTTGELWAKLTSVGFTVKRVTYANSLLFPLAGMKRLMEGKIGQWGSDLRLPSAGINRWLMRTLFLEAWLLVRTNLPWGLSVIAIAVK
ncbi:MAG: class I SAM-dependent methyltransferase [Chloroflexi bacterium]|nr:class I SAM-dependent methyltransferase [Chloroflexota bacterium]MCL5074475.1 class I SAM-dependent methyltransferase [Chloroflexota bacterium]